MKKMHQDYEKYTKEDLAVWTTLLERQLKNLSGKAHPEYMRCIDNLSDVLNPKKNSGFQRVK